LVVGGGPAGIAAGIAARQAGLRVTIADHCRPPIDKACGEGLLPNGVAALRSLGVELTPHIAFPFRGIRFEDNKSSVAAAFPGGPGFGVRRTVLHEILIQRAMAAGVDFLWGARVSLQSQDRIAVDGQAFQCNWVVGADGQNSGVRSWAGLAPLFPGRSRFGFRRHFQAAPWSDCVEVHWGDRCQIVVTPTSSSEICVVVFTENPQLRLDCALPQFPAMAAKLHGAPITTFERGDMTTLRRLPTVVRGRVALIGDASGSMDALTGYGLSLAFQQALHLADALVRNDLCRYQSAHQQLAVLPGRMSRLLVAMHDSAWIRRRALRLFAQKPDLFSKVLSVHTGQSVEASLGAGQVLELGWQILTA